ncbi:Probable RNA-directed DNA polymerase from transposon BS [Eumeta japonica]|uniref:Probable RNA-directed DNA polymerase from transposon BS n=1 Tax=Eumeta variegata TaxID=151549 RepID=A0A4C1ZDR7_EUMVA|nr:Probable RNA-directed DNA polymerase from transposon BS [Eumeta japonica]
MGNTPKTDTTSGLAPHTPAVPSLIGYDLSAHGDTVGSIKRDSTTATYHPLYTLAFSNGAERTGAVCEKTRTANGTIINGQVAPVYRLKAPYISNRHFTFRLDNTYSSVKPIRAGVPRGFTLSPLLYSAYVNNIPLPQTGVQLALFVDDTALFLRSNCLRNILPRLQRAIDELT